MKGGTISCIFLHETPVDIYAYKIPVFLLLFINSIIMIWIMLVNRDSKDIFIQLFFNHEYLNRGFNLYFTFSSKHFYIILFEIFQLVFSKLYKQTSVELDRRHFRALKAMFVIMPVLGFTYVLTIVGPSHSESPTGHKVFQAIRATLLSTQGFVVTLPYCYLNTEVGTHIYVRGKG